ncbi:Lovastatin diketide synthase mokB [Talaromyces pinophilus]|nr:Lovastatin diketide synthase mokB [Talaromyces pinophilus]
MSQAATQVVELVGRSSTEIQYYDIRDVSLSKALIIPEDDHGIETLFSLRPAFLNANSGHQWVFEFTLTSVSIEEGRDIFSEHCRGLVEVRFERYEFPESQMVKHIQDAASIKKAITAGQWYQTFARVGLCYGPTFQGLSGIFAVGDKDMIEAQVDLEPAAKIVKGESRYLLRPATLDASMQLSILAAYKSDVTKFQRAFMPTAFDSSKVWPKRVGQGHGFAKSYASAHLKGVRRLSSDIVLLNAHHQRMLEVNNVFLTASDQSAPEIIENSSPYTRIVWKPDFGHLSTTILEKMYKPVAMSDDAVIHSLNHLALHQLIHFKAKIFCMFHAITCCVNSWAISYRTNLSPSGTMNQSILSIFHQEFLEGEI